MLPNTPQNDFFYNQYKSTLVETAQRLGAHDISEENWKVMAKYPDIMDEILQKCSENYKNNWYIKQFYEINPELCEDKQLALHFLHRLSDAREVETLFNFVPNENNYFFSNIKDTATWVSKNPEMLYLSIFDSLRGNEEFFKYMQENDNLLLSWFKLPCPDNKERIEKWLNYNGENYLYLPEKYKNDNDLFLQVLKQHPNFQKEIFSNAPLEQQNLYEANLLLAQNGKYSLIVAEHKADPKIFNAYCDYKLSLSKNPPNVDFLNELPGGLWKNRQNVQKILETVSQLKPDDKVTKNYKAWLTTMKNIKKYDEFISSVFDDTENGKAKWHMGLTASEYAWSDSVFKKYFSETLKELAEQYKVYNNAKSLDIKLPHKTDTKIVSKMKI